MKHKILLVDDEKDIIEFLEYNLIKEGYDVISDHACYVLGVDMAHVGRRYGDEFAARASEGQMAEVAVRDRARIERLGAADVEGFWELLRENEDDQSVCPAPFSRWARMITCAPGRSLACSQVSSLRASFMVRKSFWRLFLPTSS